MATISGIIFDDVNQIGVYSTGAAGIPNVSISLLQPDGVCLTATSDASGAYSFTDLSQIGDYTLYETVSTPNACPPTTFTQPTGFRSSSTQRTIIVNIPNAGSTSSTNYFGHTNPLSFSCTSDGIQVAQNPSQLYNINLVTGQLTAKGPLQPSGLYNAIGYNIIDNNLYGYSGGKIILINTNQKVGFLAPVPNLPVISLVTGDINLNGWLYLYAPNNPRFYVVDMNPNSASYLQLIDPVTGLIQTSNFGVPLSLPSFIVDWSFNPLDNQLYAVISNTTNAVRINPITGSLTILTTTGLPTPGPYQYGATFSDSAGVLYALNNNLGNVYRITFSGNNATASLFSTAAISSSNDGARCALASTPLLQITQEVNKVAALLGDTLTYTSVITNQSLITVTGVIFTDSIPTGTAYVNGSTTLNGSSTTDDPVSGVQVGSLASGGSATVSFQVTIDNTMPTTNPIPNTSSATFDTGSPIASNTVTTRVFDTSRGVLFI